jgi:hypothetical protein
MNTHSFSPNCGTKSSAFRPGAAWQFVVAEGVRSQTAPPVTTCRKAGLTAGFRGSNVHEITNDGGG